MGSKLFVTIPQYNCFGWNINQPQKILRLHLSLLFVVHSQLFLPSASASRNPWNSFRIQQTKARAALIRSRSFKDHIYAPMHLIIARSTLGCTADRQFIATHLCPVVYAQHIQNAFLEAMLTSYFSCMPQGGWNCFRPFHRNFPQKGTPHSEWRSAPLRRPAVNPSIYRRPPKPYFLLCKNFACCFAQNMQPFHCLFKPINTYNSAGMYN